MRIELLRNIEYAEVDIQGARALFIGGNGAGKTTVLESVYLLARGRSFRGRKSGDLTTVGCDRTTVEGVIAEADRGSVRKISYVRRQAVRERWINGVPIADSAGFYDGFLVRLLGDGSYRLLEGEPALRRGFLDLNVFHVEQGGGVLLSRFKRVLEQRNAWLRGGGRGRPVWDSQFALTGLDLHHARSRLFLDLESEFRFLSREFAFLEGSRLVLRCGWGDDRSLEEALAADRVGERKAGFTRVGPQRADFGVFGEFGALRLSRGQVKVLVCLLQLAFDRIQRQRLGYGSIWLIDDIWAELDGESSRTLCGLLCAAGEQCLFTAVGNDRKAHILDLPSDTQLFHVERGAVLDIS